MPTPGWLRQVDLPVDGAGRRYIDTANLDQILDQFPNWRADVNAGGHNLYNAVLHGAALVDTAIVELKGTTPTVAWYEPDAPADEKRWKMYPADGAMLLNTPNDTDSATGTFLSFYRDGFSPNFVQLNGGVITLKGNGSALGFPGNVNDFAMWALNLNDAAGQHGLACGSRYRATTSYELMVGSVYNTGGGFQIDFAIDGTGDIITPGLRTTYPGAGSKKWWADPAAGYVIKFAI